MPDEEAFRLILSLADTHPVSLRQIGNSNRRRQQI